MDFQLNIEQKQIVSLVDELGKKEETKWIFN